MRHFQKIQRKLMIGSEKSMLKMFFQEWKQCVKDTQAEEAL